ncbi:aspartate ammonia-lyase [Gloeobacter violaceus]|uniref:aspartate ammonia-lyase n=1 Tax=Gloeobacter violaceus (strain ATCC 29082 / PCC 7421) TaxID=251221 RepID=Q7NKM0_GLOVI|nr:aspartate ammonia-lyase [Gloeobacter violaceus]BAC89398.1 glr1457 [Gloeobacter violaceus PCC 7421]
MQPRTERDSMGERTLEAGAYYGIQTLRAVENFPISGIGPLPDFVRACTLIKRAAARVNAELECIPKDVAQAIIGASDEVLAGQWSDQFVVDIFQAGAGTSHHMNINEVLANRALELLGYARGDYKQVNPNDHVNYGQSTNDVIPTAIRLGALFASAPLLEALSTLQQSFEAKGNEFLPIVKSGRTHLQDAVPIRLGDEFLAYAQIVGEHRARIETACRELLVLGLGGSAAGTGLNTHPQYRVRVVAELARLTGHPLTPAPRPMAAMQSMAPFVAVSGSLRNLAQDLVKIAGDLRLMDSGPKTGLREIELPPVQPGSSIMPGKYNPVLCEMLTMVAFQVMGYDQAIALAAQAGQLELNVMMPLIAYDLLHSFTILTNALTVFRARCIDGIQAQPERCLAYAEGSIALVTALNPHIGYLNAAAVAKESLATGRSLREIVLERGLLTEAQLAEILDLEAMSRLPETQAASDR